MITENQMRTTTPDAFFVLERIDDDGSPPMAFFLKRDPEDKAAAAFVDELSDLSALLMNRPEELQRRYGVQAIYAVLIVTSTKIRMHEIRDALSASYPPHQYVLGDFFWFATDADFMAEPNIGKVRWLTADDQRRPIVWDASKWVVTAYQEAG